MKALILTGDGVNCENETARAFEKVGIPSEILLISDFLDSPKKIHDYQLLALPGGFSYGDDLGSGKVFAQKIKKVFGNELQEFIKSKKPILGICNGFQILCTLKLLDGDKYKVALEHNDSGRFINKWVDLDIPKSHCVWTKGLKTLRLPIRHGEGKLIGFFDDSIKETTTFLNESGLVALNYEKNPNGSLNGIAGLTDKSGLILGLMPHPEAATESWHYPGGCEDQDHLGIDLFKNIAKYLQENFK